MPPGADLKFAAPTTTPSTRTDLKFAVPTLWVVNFLTAGEVEKFFLAFSPEYLDFAAPNLRFAVRGGPPPLPATLLMQGVFSVNFESFTIYNVLGDKGQIIGGGGDVCPHPSGICSPGFV